MIRVTADSNIYVSALHFGGPPDKFLDLARTRVIHLTISDDILAEVTRVLRSKRAVLVNIEIMRAFVRLRRMLASHADLERRLDDLEKKYDAKFKVVFDAIRQLMIPPEKKHRPIGFHNRRE